MSLIADNRLLPPCSRSVGSIWEPWALSLEADYVGFASPLRYCENDLSSLHSCQDNLLGMTFPLRSSVPFLLGIDLVSLDAGHLRMIVIDAQLAMVTSLTVFGSKWICLAFQRLFVLIVNFLPLYTIAIESDVLFYGVLRIRVESSQVQGPPIR